MAAPFSRANYLDLCRVKVNDPTGWAYKAGTDFYIKGGANGLATSGNAHELADYGWTTTSLVLADGSTADFIEPSDVGTPSVIGTNASGDKLLSPAIFGDYANALLAARCAGMKNLPRSLVLEAYAAFSVASAGETVTGLGFVEDGGAPETAADHLAYIYSDGTNFGCRSGADSDAGALVDNNYHLFRIVITKRGTDTADLVEWFIDDVSQGTLDIEGDEWPASFGMYASTTNRIQLAWARVFYDW